MNRKEKKILADLSAMAAAIPKVANSRIAAAIVWKGRTISFGNNSYKTSPFQKKYADNEFKIFLHAEIAAIRKALKILPVGLLKGTTLYVCRIKQGGWGNSKPCLGCQRAIAEFGIKKVLYTTETGVEVL